MSEGRMMTISSTIVPTVTMLRAIAPLIVIIRALTGNRDGAGAGSVGRLGRRSPQTGILPIVNRMLTIIPKEKTCRRGDIGVVAAPDGAHPPHSAASWMRVLTRIVTPTPTMPE